LSPSGAASWLAWGERSEPQEEAQKIHGASERRFYGRTNDRNAPLGLDPFSAQTWGSLRSPQANQLAAPLGLKGERHLRA